MKKSRKMEKILMGQGIPRNDARAYLQVRRYLQEKKIRVAGLEDRYDAPPVIRGTEAQPVTYRAKFVVPRQITTCAHISQTEHDAMVHRYILDELMQALKRDRVVQIRRESTPLEIRYMGELTVLVPEKKEKVEVKLG